MTRNSPEGAFGARDTIPRITADIRPALDALHQLGEATAALEVISSALSKAAEAQVNPDQPTD